MILTLEQWKEILNSNEGNILEAIKEELKEKHEDIYQEWEEKNFNVDHLFDVSLTTNDRQLNLKSTLLHIAAYNGHLDIVKYLVDEKKVSPDQKANDGINALHWAALNGHLDIVKYLVDEKKVSPDQKANDGRTALHWAALNGHLDIVKYLREKGIYPLLKDKGGKTPRDLANDENIRQLLKEAETKQIISKAIKTGVTLSIITALTVGIGCGIAGVELSILAIAVAAALVIGVIAGGITYSVSRPSDKLDKPDLEVTNQQVSEKTC
ncbi:ankyrin repeat domain-containing protein [Wolbachia endosymbiont (group B) of Cyclophora punctaria]|uniref:ankyrin repeat domain-containing protein n=1 Tax=Wolbachia endosymbiont (group B) of Cyclophora punctaria TaxID=3066168 RepID=UPI003340C4E8